MRARIGRHDSLYFRPLREDRFSRCKLDEREAAF